MILNVRRLRPDAVPPAYAHPGDAGLDLCAAEGCLLPPGGTARVGTGLAIELPPGTEGQVRPRSGLAMKHAVTVLNAPGTIDEGYRGEVAVLLVNHGREPFRIEPGMKIAQLVVQPVLRVEVCEAETLSETRRGAGGFGSTGMRARKDGP
jgi:dUTP pyrophosphatase